jgi:uncharacterized protein
LSEVICNTSPLQYLYQLGMLHVFHALAGHIIVPPAVVHELAVGRAQGVSLPDPTVLEWITVRPPASTAVLALALESTDAIVILDDALARQMATTLAIRFRGSLGVLLDAKQVGLISAITPLLDQLQALGFHLSAETRKLILDLANESLS